MLILAVCGEHVNKAMLSLKVNILKPFGILPIFYQLDLLFSAVTWGRDIAGVSILVLFTFLLSSYIDSYNGLNWW